MIFEKKCSTNIKRKSRNILLEATSVPNVNLVDGLSSAHHTEAVARPMGSLGQRLSVAENLGNADFIKNVLKSIRTTTQNEIFSVDGVTIGAYLA